jgi:hypothetical protein
MERARLGCDESVARKGFHFRSEKEGEIGGGYGGGKEAVGGVASEVVL